jgi:catechol 2,3-dioxygenase-like lactoylglutathione lyase family enzyme
MLDHITIGAVDFGRSSAFYDQALAPLGIDRVMAVTAEESGGYQGIGYGSAGKPFFWMGAAPGGEPTRGQLHIAFTADSRAAVDGFYAAAMAAGGKDNGPPGLRAHYHPNYYGAFVLDPDGHNIEAVCHAPG